MSDPHTIERQATVMGTWYSGSIAFVSFEDSAGNEFQLAGDRRMLDSINHFIGKEVRVFITSEYDWRWLPLSDPNLDPAEDEEEDEQ